MIIVGLSIGYKVRGLPRPGIVAVSARQLKPVKKLMMKLTTKSKTEFGQARF